MNQIRVSVSSSDDCFRCERLLDDARIPFKLMVQAGNLLFIGVADRSLRQAFDALHQAGFTLIGI